MQRYNEKMMRDVDGDWFSTGMTEDDKGKYVLYEDVKELNEECLGMIEELCDILAFPYPEATFKRLRGK